MADKKELSKETVSDARTATDPVERKFPLKVLRENSIELFGVTSSTFAGATSQQKDQEYTISEIKKIIETWLKKEVK